MVHARTRGAGCLALALCLLVPGCAAKETFAPAALDLPAGPTPALVRPPAATAALSPSPPPDAPPQPVTATIGAVGDVMAMQSQVTSAWRDSTGSYDFSPSFAALSPWLAGVDLMCANLETPLAGAEAGYSGPAPAKPTPAPDGSAVKGELQTFNAPDALAAALKGAGFDVLTTANNHCLDRGGAGLLRTAQTLRGAGLTQLGTYLSEADRDAPRVLDVNGIRVGLLAWTFSVNGNEGVLSSESRAYAVARLDKARMAEDIRRCREAGAEFLIAFPHWDVEFMSAPSANTRKLAAWLLSEGADAVLGSHPHVVQPAEYVTVQRDGKPYTGLVVYSMGNFLSNMSPSPEDYGLFVRLTLQKAPDGTVTLASAGLLPLYCIKHRAQGRPLHEVLPALSDPAAVTAYGPLTEADRVKLAAARTHVETVCGAAVPMLDAAATESSLAG